jgi:hypothetical protein
MTRPFDPDEYQMWEWLGTARRIREVGEGAIPPDPEYWASREGWCLGNAIGFASRRLKPPSA